MLSSGAVDALVRVRTEGVTVRFCQVLRQPS
jgi:hypothetical protein